MDSLGTARDFRDWTDLPWDILSEIFNKIGTLGVFMSAQFVCRDWWKLANEPRMYRYVDIKYKDWTLYLRDFDSTDVFFMSFASKVELLGLAAIDRSSSYLVEFIIDGDLQFVSDAECLLQRIVERSSNRLKVIDLGCNFRAQECIFIEACKSFPLLEVLDISDISFTKVGIESIGNSCPNLKVFGFRNYLNIKSQYKSCNQVAYAIAKNMCSLQKLKIIEDMLDDDGLLAILDGCPLLKHLHIRNCFNIKIGEKLKNNFGKVRLKYYSFLVHDFIDYDSNYDEYGNEALYNFRYYS
ncbi:hypothetical protein ZOSMA_67G00120 [Zostera marina]|uniref:F-box domain-containing protein n=1 Tax=Zostera marina TaxID=29655 RepID=A0A0K9NU87_ZOSMR|nr:hypothetical protein ZOSMA_67G00120 [Zostera marina]